MLILFVMFGILRQCPQTHKLSAYSVLCNIQIHCTVTPPPLLKDSL